MTAFLFFSPSGAPPQLGPVISHLLQEQVWSFQALGGWKCPGKRRGRLSHGVPGKSGNAAPWKWEALECWALAEHVWLLCHQIYPPWEPIQPGKLHPTFGWAPCFPDCATLCFPKTLPNCSFLCLLTLGTGNKLGAARAVLGRKRICTCTKINLKDICVFRDFSVPFPLGASPLWGTGVAQRGSGAFESWIFCIQDTLLTYPASVCTREGEKHSQTHSEGTNPTCVTQAALGDSFSRKRFAQPVHGN